MRSPSKLAPEEKVDLTPTYVENTEATEATFRFEIDHINTLEGGTCSQLFSFRNLAWRIFVAPHRDMGPSRSLSFYLHCDGRNVTPTWSCKVDIDFRLMSAEPNGSAYVRKFRHTFDQENNSWGYPTFISWMDVASEGTYMRNNSVTVEVELMVLD